MSSYTRVFGAAILAPELQLLSFDALRAPANSDHSLLEADAPPETGCISSPHLHTPASASKDDGEDDEDSTTSNDRLLTWCPTHPFIS